MMHLFKLDNEPFLMILSGRKKYELRLNDEKRRLLSIGDEIIFINNLSFSIMKVIIEDLLLFPDFTNLYQKLSATEIGYNENEPFSPLDMLKYYSANKQEKYGVVAIKVKPSKTPQADLEKAVLLAINTHTGQKDKGGHNYIYHPLSVCEMVKTEPEKIVALLHDVVEDSDVTIKEIKEILGLEIAEAISCLTKTNDKTYWQYLEKVKSNELAKNVKIADMKHNSDLTRLKQVTDEDKKRVEKYRQAIEFLIN